MKTTNGRDSELPGGLVSAYRKTCYHAQQTPAGRVECLVDTHNPALDALLAESGSSSAGFITADNPFGLVLPTSKNRSRHQELTELVRLNGWTCYPGLGGDADQAGWPPEQSLLVIGISRHELTGLGLYFQQNAVVYAERGRAGELLLLR